MNAARRGYTDIVRILLSYGADPTIKNSKDRYPLASAIAEGHEEIVKLLKEAMAAKRKSDTD